MLKIKYSNWSYNNKEKSLTYKNMVIRGMKTESIYQK